MLFKHEDDLKSNINDQRNGHSLDISDCDFDGVLKYLFKCIDFVYFDGRDYILWIYET